MLYTWSPIFITILVVHSSISLEEIEHDPKGFDDNILFDVQWPGLQESLDNVLGESEQDANKSQAKDFVKVQTHQKESYNCHIPEVIVPEQAKLEDYDGPSPIELLKPLFTQQICSYRLESYWSYEVCHGRYIRQYHEERDGKLVKTQEYFLGHWSVDRHRLLETEHQAAKERKEKPSLIKVDGLALPYVEMVMNNGTICDLSGKPRLTKVRYVCYVHGKHEVYSFKETATCKYEIIVLSPLLCDHPQYKPKDASDNVISCTPLGGAPKKPRSLLTMEVEALKQQQQTFRLLNDVGMAQKAKDVVAVLKVAKIQKDGETQLKFEVHPLTEVGDVQAQLAQEALSDDSPVRAFLNGESCLNGGTGWWKYEFCYGKHVSQYHVDRTGRERTTVLLGKYDEEAHLDWIKDNKAKAPKPVAQRTSISHYYSGGDICDKTGKPRRTEVKLKCLENSSSSAQVSLYLLEPRTCHYILGVESPLICEILPLADENGLVKFVLPPVKEAASSASQETDLKDSDKLVEDYKND